MIRVRVQSLLLACVAVPAAILAGCGGGGGSSSVDVGPAAAVPANAALYLDGTVKPTGTAQANAKAALSKILKTPDPGAKIISLIEKQSKADGHPINYQQDVAPWLGQKAGVFFTSLGQTSKGAAVVETTNPSAALAFARKASGATATSPAPQAYNGASYQTDPSSPPGPDQTVFGTVDNKYLVEGDLDGFKAAVDAAKGDSLGDDGDFKDAIGNLPSDRLGTLYTVPKDLISALGPDAVRRAGAAAAREGRRRLPRQADRRRAHGERGQHPGRCNRREQRRRDPRELAARRRPLAVLARPRNRQSRRRRQADRRSAQGSDPELRRGRPADPVDHRLIA